jgi:cyclic beta-1,2-glucan synthetase
MLRVALESVLGVRVVGGTMLTVKPCIPDHWPGFTVRLRLPDWATRYEVTVRGSEGSTAVVRAVEIDGVRGLAADGAAQVPLAGDGREHRVVVTLGPRLAGTKESPDSGV